MAISPYVQALRAKVGSELLLLPSVTVLPWDEDGRVLLVREASQGGRWGTIGGLVEPGERPEEAAIREAHEEAGVEVELTGIRTVVGGDGYVVEYPGGDRTAYVSTVYDARVVRGTPTPDGHETLAVRWFDSTSLATVDLTTFTSTLVADLGLG